MTVSKIQRRWLLLLPIFFMAYSTSDVMGKSKKQSPWVGAYTGCLGCNTNPAILWKQKNQAIGDGKLTYSRTFDPTIRPVGQESWRKTPSPKHFYSMKPPGNDNAGFIAGKYDREYQAMIRALPSESKITIHHEPENEMSGRTFYQLIKHAHDLAHSVRKDIQIWYVASGFQWETNKAGNVSSSDGWLEAAKYVDRVGIDVYATKKNFKPLSESKGFKRWWTQIVVPAGKAKTGQWGVPERGISGDNGEQARIAILNADWKWVTSQNADLFMYWDYNPKGKYYELDRPNEQKAFQAITAQGRQQ
jgi:hypothetical protein